MDVRKPVLLYLSPKERAYVEQQAKLHGRCLSAEMRYLMGFADAERGKRGKVERPAEPPKPRGLIVRATIPHKPVPPSEDTFVDTVRQVPFYD